jgi:poly(3-hydroxyalkanoate) synthetase
MAENLEDKLAQYGFYNPQAYLEYIHKFYSSVQDFLNYPYHPHSTDNKILWQNGSCKLLDFGIKGKSYNKIILFIPSFINKSYILDLTEQCSLLKYCANSDYQPVLLDWGEPTNEEKGYDFTAYITKKVLPALTYLQTLTQEIVIAGYCLGGLVAIATAQLVPNNIKGLILLATPWDFSHFKEKSQIFETSINLIISNDEPISSTYLRYFFYSLMPLTKIYDKFIKFSQDITNQKKAELFVAVERWAMDNMYIAEGVFKECANDFIKDNKPLNNKWLIDNKLIDLTKVQANTLIVVPTKDVIVPYNSVMPLINLIPKNTVVLPESGHVGMIIGEKAKTQLWQPMIKWLKSL